MGGLRDARSTHRLIHVNAGGSPRPARWRRAAKEACCRDLLLGVVAALLGGDGAGALDGRCSRRGFRTRTGLLRAALRGRLGIARFIERGLPAGFAVTLDHDLLAQRQYGSRLLAGDRLEADQALLVLLHVHHGEGHATAIEEPFGVLAHLAALEAVERGRESFRRHL